MPLAEISSKWSHVAGRRHSGTRGIRDTRRLVFGKLLAIYLCIRLRIDS